MTTLVADIELVQGEGASRAAQEPAPTQIVELRPQAGPQEAFLASGADIVVGGGGAGGGKTWDLLVEPLRHVGNPTFGCVIFRRTYPQIMRQGGLWDMSRAIYHACHAQPRGVSSEWVFPSGARVQFAHMQYDDDRYEWDGAQIPLLEFDQLEHFSYEAFFYMLARNRTMCGVRPYIRATCNPDPDHWLRRFMAWWIDEATGYPIWERSGRIRWFARNENEDGIQWADTRQELVDQLGRETTPLSFTFIPSRVTDNKILLERNPEYLSNLRMLPNVDRERLLYGNWNIRWSAGAWFQRDWFEVVNAAPGGLETVRYWDRAATEHKPGSNGNGTHRGSWTAGVKLGKDARGVFYVIDVCRFQGSPLDVEMRIKNVASQDGANVQIGIEQDPGQAGKAEAQYQVRNLAGFNATMNAVREAKGIRAKPLSAQVQAGNVKLVCGGWNEDFMRELQNFDGSDSCVSDQVDAASGAFLMLARMKRAGVW